MRPPRLQSCFLPQRDAGWRRGVSSGMEITVKTQDGRKMAFRSPRTFASADDMLATFVSIHAESITREGWEVSVTTATGSR